jgi:hypothetical protein
LGIKVKETKDELLEDKVIYYPLLLIVKLIAVVIKEAKKRNLENIPDEASRGLSYVLSHINLIEPDSEDLRIIYTVSKKGWKDIFDLLLYATNIRKKLQLLTLDKEFVEFLTNNGFDISNIIVLK